MRLLVLAAACAVLAGFVILALTLSRTPSARERVLAGFVGSPACATCHTAEATAWRSSDHANAMAAASPATILGDFSNVTVSDGQHTATFYRDRDRHLVRTDGPGGIVADFAVSETFGVDPLQQYLVLFPDGRRQALPWAWDSRPREVGGQRWFHLQAHAALHAGDPLHWTGRDQTWNFMCASCHSTGLERRYDTARDRYDTTWSEISVGCESCHGPGAAHVAWAHGGAPPATPNKALSVVLREAAAGGWRFTDNDRRGIAHWDGPPRQSAAAQVEICAPCHARARAIVPDPQPGERLLNTHAPMLLVAGEYHADGQIQGEVFEWGSFAQSRMHRAGVMCSDCHNPHSLQLRAEGNAVCAQCHLPEKFDTTSHHHHTSGSAGAQCVACHMPAVTYMGVDRRRDHAFSRPRPDIAAAIGAPDVCTTCHVGQHQAWAAERLAAWFGPPRRDAPHPALAIAASRRGDRSAEAALAGIATDRDQSGILRATALSLLPQPAGRAGTQAVGATLHDPDPLVRAAALRALDALHPANRMLAARLLADATRLVRIEAARALAPVPVTALPQAMRAGFDRAWEELLASERVAAERPEAHVNIAGLLSARGDVAGAEAAYAAALALDPYHLMALVNLADFEAARGRQDAAESTLRRAVLAHPEEPEAKYALAMALVRRGTPAAALSPLSDAAALRPAEPRYGYAEALVLHRLGRIDDAIAALARHPRHLPSLIALATFERDRGNLAAAERHSAAAVALDPANPDAAALLAELRRRRAGR